MSRFSDTLRMELEAFDIRVIELKTGGVLTNMINNNLAEGGRKLPEGSIFAPARDEVEKALRLEWADGIGITTEAWAMQVVGDLLRQDPPTTVWRGESAWMGWLKSLFSLGIYDTMLKRMTGLTTIQSIIRKQRLR